MLTGQRAYYVSLACGQASYPLNEKLGLVDGKEQGWLREKLALLAVLTPYHQTPQVCQTLVGSERHAMTLRRVALREAAHLAASSHHHTLAQRECERLYLEVDGHMCLTHEPKKGTESGISRSESSTNQWLLPRICYAPRKVVNCWRLRQTHYNERTYKNGEARAT